MTNTQGTTKCFGYLLIKAANSSRFSVEHPIHQPPYKPIAALPPLDADDTFKARNILYTPLVFNARHNRRPLPYSRDCILVRAHRLRNFSGSSHSLPALVRYRLAGNQRHSLSRQYLAATN